MKELKFTVEFSSTLKYTPALTIKLAHVRFPSIMEFIALTSMVLNVLISPLKNTLSALGWVSLTDPEPGVKVKALKFSENTSPLPVSSKFPELNVSDLKFKKSARKAVHVMFLFPA